jgi:hypothetical protein
MARPRRPASRKPVLPPPPSRHAIKGTPQNPTYGGQLTGDFSWLMEIKAQ